MSTETVFPEIEFSTLLEAWEQFLEALLIGREMADAPEGSPVVKLSGGESWSNGY